MLGSLYVFVFKEFKFDFNFKLIIEHLLNEQSSILNYNYIIIVKENINWDLITDIIKINCYRVIQEATQNINKHSKAKNIRISFLLINNSLCSLLYALKAAHSSLRNP